MAKVLLTYEIDVYTDDLTKDEIRALAGEIKDALTLFIGGELRAFSILLGDNETVTETITMHPQGEC